MLLTRQMVYFSHPRSLPLLHYPANGIDKQAYQAPYPVNGIVVVIPLIHPLNGIAPSSRTFFPSMSTSGYLLPGRWYTLALASPLPHPVNGIVLHSGFLLGLNHGFLSRDPVDGIVCEV
jgi:hypothetical protein